MQDTSRSANLDGDELGIAKVPVRTLQNISLFCKAMDMEGLSNYFANESGIVTNTSLSKDGFLDKLVTTTKKITGIGLSTPPPAKKKGLFGMGKPDTPQEQF